MTPPSIPPAGSLTPLAAALSNRFAELGITISHWKSNCRLGVIEKNEVELDLLASRDDAEEVHATLRDLGFTQMRSLGSAQHEGVYHYYGLERSAACLVHVHLYLRVVTGESLLKNYDLPVAECLFKGDCTLHGYPVPLPDIELVVFVLRASLKYASPVERRLLLRNRAALEEELAWLSDRSEAGLEEAVACLRETVPELEIGLIADAIEALECGMESGRMSRVARRVRRTLRPYRRYGTFRSYLRSASIVWSRLKRKLLDSPTDRGISSGGRVVAFVGPEASGKSTLVDATAQFYSKAFAVSTVHFGKPPPSALTALPAAMLPLLRKLAPEARTTRMEASGSEDAAPARRASPLGLRTLLFDVRSVMLAHQRLVLARRVAGFAERGRVVLCDRFPSLVVGAADSPRLSPTNESGLISTCHNWLESIERRVYSAIPLPDAVIRLKVPLADAVRRNEERVKAGKEDELYVRQRHAKADLLTYPGVPEMMLDTGGSYAATIEQARRLVWAAVTDTVPPTRPAPGRTGIGQ